FPASTAKTVWTHSAIRSLPIFRGGPSSSPVSSTGPEEVGPKFGCGSMGLSLPGRSVVEPAAGEPLGQRADDDDGNDSQPYAQSPVETTGEHEPGQADQAQDLAEQDQDPQETPLRPQQQHGQDQAQREGAEAD